MRFRSLIAFAGFGLLAAASSAHAQLVSTSGGTVLFNSTNDHDDETTGPRSLGFTTSLFGSSISSVYVSTNGNLNTIGNASFSNSGFPQSGRQFIAGLWDDLYIYQGSGQTITENVDAGNYYAVTYDVSIYSNSAPHEKFQEILFGNDVTLGGFQFHNGDIAFAYSQIDAALRGGDATVGLNAGDGVNYAVLPGTTNGVVTNSTANLIPIFPTSNQFVLFRPDGNSYSASIQSLQASAVPEPGSVALLVGLGMSGAAFLRRKRAPKAA